MLRQAHESGRLELVESLADSIKDSMAFERQANGPAGDTRPNASHVVPVSQLPKPWASWAAGWEFCYPLRLFETVGIQRAREPIEMLVGFRHEHITDPQREIRVARADASTGQLQEVPSQVWDDGRRESERVCRLAFLADVPQHGDSSYVILFGNPQAELPNYATDLRVEGNGLGLNVENEFFAARLSRQMGQLERLTSKREHGLELYAGGKGHGEPPTIDWAHDYVEQGGFQKLRMKNWSECRNYQIVQGPICVQVRRWGFPHSPLHPLITPSRMHLDVTYTFWAGLPAFFKQSTMEAIVDFQIEAMRDDEWVFSGYSFTKSLWIDAMGKLRKGPVPTGLENQTEAESSEKRQKEFVERSEMFQQELDVDETLAQLLVAEGFSELEEVAYVDPSEIAAIEGFDEDLAAELQSRAQEALERREESNRTERRELGVEDALAELPILTEAMLVVLGKAGIKILDDLADLATDELIQKAREPRRNERSDRETRRNRTEDKAGILATFGLSEEQGNEIIMAARAHWFEEEDAVAADDSQ